MTRKLHRRAACSVIAGTLMLGLQGLRASAAVEVNTATEAELDSVRGIGPDLNARIRAQREMRPFVDWDDFIRRIKPMGATKAQQLSQAGLTVAGRPYTVP